MIDFPIAKLMDDSICTRMVKKLEPILSPAFPPETPPTIRPVFCLSITDTQPSIPEEELEGDERWFGSTYWPI